MRLQSEDFLRKMQLGTLTFIRTAMGSQRGLNDVEREGKNKLIHHSYIFLFRQGG